MESEAVRPARRGRPTAPRKPGQRSTLSLRLTAEMFTELDKSAKEQGRPISQEAEIRLWASYRNQGSLQESLEATFGPDAAELLMLLGRLARHAPGVLGIPVEDHWASDPTAFHVAEREIMHAVARLRPPGDPAPLAGESPEHRADRLLVHLGKIPVPAEWGKEDAQ
jgi:hypothetical protein